MTKRSTLLGSAFTLLLAFSIISYTRTFAQEPKVIQPTQNPAQAPAEPVIVQVSTEVTRPTKVSDAPAVETTKPASTLAEAASENPTDTTPVTSSVTAAGNARAVTVSQTYTATAYSLRGRTASGKPVSRGLIAADPSVLPLGSRVRVEAGLLSGEYVVADTGGAVKGRHIDIWTPTTREARQFGRRAVKLTVLSLGAKPLIHPRRRR